MRYLEILHRYLFGSLRSVTYCSLLTLLTILLIEYKNTGSYFNEKYYQDKVVCFGTYLLLVMATLLIGFVLLQNNRTLKNVITSFL